MAVYVRFAPHPRVQGAAPPQDGHFFVSLPTCPRSKVAPGGTERLSPDDESIDSGFSILLQGSPSTSQFLRGYINTSGDCESPCGLSVSLSTLCQNCFATLTGTLLVTRCLPRHFNGLANFNARLGSRCWLGFTASGLSPDKRRARFARRTTVLLCGGSAFHLVTRGFRVTPMES